MKDSLDGLLSRMNGKPVTAPPLGNETPPEAPDGEELTIGEMDGRYSSMRPSNKPLTRLHLILKDGKVRTLQYHFIDVLGTFDGREFVFVFAGTKHYQVTVKGYGPKLWAIYDYVALHRWPYLREASGSLPGADGETVLTEIKIQDVTPRSDD